LNYGQKTSLEVSYMMSWDETVLTSNKCSLILEGSRVLGKVILV